MSGPPTRTQHALQGFDIGTCVDSQGGQRDFRAENSAPHSGCAVRRCCNRTVQIVGVGSDRSVRQLLSTRSSLLFGSVFTVHAVIAFAVGEVAWDDGYITLAFARTFAETGHIGLTPSSEIVEGATSPAWFLLVTGVAKLGITDFYWLHLAAQLLTALCAAIAAVLLYRLILPSVPRLAWWISLITLLLGPFRAETANGMEMTLACVVVLGIIYHIRDGDEQPLFGAATLAAIVPWIRLEAAAYTVTAGIAIVVLSRRHRTGMAIIGSSALSTLALGVVRYLVFGTFGLTNTMVAKENSPYSPPYGTPAWLHQFIYTIVVEPTVTVLPAIVLGFLLTTVSGTRARVLLKRFLKLSKSRQLPPRISFGSVYALSYIGATLLVGSNYFNRPGRMGAAAMVALVVVAALAIPVARQVAQARPLNKWAICALFLVPCLGVLADDTAWIYIARLGPNEIVTRHSTTAYRENGEAMEYVRELLGQPVISALFADVGAASLCCERIRVLDLGLLANRDLAESGWDKFPDYLATKRPDLIQTHGVWSQESGIYQSTYFREHYTPVVVDNSLFYLRNDHFRSVEARCVRASVSGAYFYSGWEALSSKSNAEDVTVIDHDFVRSLPLSGLCRLR